MAEWTSSVASSASIARIGKKPYATVPNASRIQWLSVKPDRHIGARPASGSFLRTHASSVSQSGDSIGERVPPDASIQSSS